MTKKSKKHEPLQGDEDRGSASRNRDDHAEKESPFQGDEDILDENAPMGLEIVEISPGNQDVPVLDDEISELEEDAAVNFLINKSSATDPPDELTRDAEDEGVQEEFRERQIYAHGAEDLLNELREYHGVAPELTGDDVDADWRFANEAGEETVGGTVTTPDQSVVDENGKAAGLTYRDDEELDYGKVARRDRNRWELDPSSAESDEARRQTMGDDAYDQRAGDLDEDLLDDEIEVGSLGIRGAGGSGMLEDTDEAGRDEVDLEDEKFEEDPARDFLDDDDEEEVEEDGEE